jgi:hypothetical protein
MMAAEQMARARLLALLSKKIGRTGSKRLTLYFHLLTGKTTIGPMPHQNKSRPFGSMTQFGKLLDGRDKWIEDLDLLVDGSPVASEWEPFGLESGQSVVIRGGWIEGNALSDDGVPLVQAFVAWKQGQDNH